MMLVQKRGGDCAATVCAAGRAIGALCLRAVFLCVAVGAVTPSAIGADAGGATSSRAAREDAIRAIPWRTMQPDDRHRAQFVIQNAGIYRRLPTRIIDCDPDMFTFLV